MNKPSIESERQFFQNFISSLPEVRSEVEETISSLEDQIQNRDVHRESDINTNIIQLRQQKETLLYINHVEEYLWSDVITLARYQDDEEEEPLSFRPIRLTDDFYGLGRDGSSTPPSLPRQIDEKLSIHGRSQGWGLACNALIRRIDPYFKKNGSLWRIYESPSDTLHVTPQEIRGEANIAQASPIPLPEFLKRLSYDQFKTFYYSHPHKNYLLNGVAGSGKTTWALARPHFLCLGLDEDVQLGDQIIKRFDPIPIESCLGIVKSPYLVDLLRRQLSEFQSSPVHRMRVLSWYDISNDFVDNFKEQGYNFQYDHVTYGVEDEILSPLGYLQVHQLAERYILDSLINFLLKDLKKIGLSQYEIDYKSHLLEHNGLKYRESRETYHQTAPLDEMINYIHRLWSEHGQGLNSSNKSLKFDYSEENFSGWLFTNSQRLIKNFPPTATSSFKQSLTQIMLAGSRSIHQHNSSNKRALHGREFDFLTLFMLNMRGLVSDGTIRFNLPQEYQSLQHIFVDEYQDLTEVQNRIIEEMVGQLKVSNETVRSHSRSGSITRVGDVHQRLSLHDGFLDRNQLSSLGDAHKITFNKNFRQTHYLGDLASRFHQKFQSGKKIELVEHALTDEKPCLIDSSVEQIISHIQDDIRDSNITSIAIIVKEYEDNLDELTSAFRRSHISYKRIDEIQRDEKNSGAEIIICRPVDVKGLQFDSVYVLGVEDYRLQSGLHRLVDSNQLYVALTRARLRERITLATINSTVYTGNPELMKLVSKYCIKG